MTSVITSRRAHLALFLAALLTLAVLSPIGAAMLSPAFALVAALWSGAFPDERLILAIRRRLRRPRRSLIPALAPRPAATAPRRVRTLGFALAVRPPPAGALLQL